MKGAAMKLGQVLSLPRRRPRARGVPRGVPAQAGGAARRRSDGDLQGHAQGDRKGPHSPLAEVFDEFDEDPIAAASIGQVYRAKLHDGREVAVKVQYPGIASAVRADMQNLGMILRIVKRIAPGLDPKAIGDEIRERIEEELDYELEATNQRSLARIFKGHPFILVPNVVTSLSRERVLVSEFVAGRRLRGDAGAARRQSATGSARSSSASTSAACTATASSPATRIPGNCILLDDGRVAFLDFGLFKTIDAEAAEFELQAQRLGIERRRGRADPAHVLRRLDSRDPEHYSEEQRARAMVRRHGLVVHAGQGDPAGARDRDRRADPDERSRARGTSRRCATSRCRPTTCSAGAWRC